MGILTKFVAFLIAINLADAQSSLQIKVQNKIRGQLFYFVIKNKCLYKYLQF